MDPGLLVEGIGLQEGWVVADIGCGDGFYSIPLARKAGNHGTVYALDADMSALASLRENIRKAGVSEDRFRLIHGDAMSTGIPSGELDLVFIANMFHDIEEKGEFLKEIKRILKPSGLLVDIDWQKTVTPFGPPPGIRIGQDEAERMFTSAGLEEVRRIEPGPYHYGLIYRKTGKRMDEGKDHGDRGHES